MTVYRVRLEVSGTVTVVVVADTEADACRRAEREPILAGDDATVLGVSAVSVEAVPS
jgi:hypothetical protein